MGSVRINRGYALYLYRVIGASRSEPLPSGADGDFVYIYVYMFICMVRTAWSRSNAQGD